MPGGGSTPSPRADVVSRPKYAEVVCSELTSEDSRMALDSHLMGAQLGRNQTGDEVLNSWMAADSHLMGAQLG